MNDTPPVIDNLWTPEVTPENYASREKYYDHIFEQYKIFVDMADKISERRNTANAFFLTLHTLLVGTASFFYEKGPKVTSTWLNIFPLVVSLILCYVWWRVIRSYRQLNTAKYKVIGEYERKLPTSPYWNAEWKALGEGKDPNLYVPLTDIENWIPVLFGLIYIVISLAVAL